MATLPLNEIRANAYAFVKEWQDERREEAEAQSFWNEFFAIFGLNRRRLAIFERRVQKLSGRTGFIDVFWPGYLLAEHKSRGQDLYSATDQAFSYLDNLPDEELPRYLVVSDFERFLLYDLAERGTVAAFTIQELPEHIEYFNFMAGYKPVDIRPEDPVNTNAAERMGLLHDKLRDIGYTGHNLERYLVRLLFCLFAEDTGIFELALFHDLIQLHTAENGSDLAEKLSQLFQVLNTPPERRLTTLPQHFADFPYINGDLFAESLPIAGFDQGMRKILLDACKLNWSRISPAIFGSLFQSVMDAAARRDLGAHYTSETNILKVVNALFLDDLRTEFEHLKALQSDRRGRLERFHDKLASLKFFDPACGCGNFLIITYRELRLLELEVLQAIYSGRGVLDIADFVRVNVDQFYGIEYEEFPSQIAQVAMWLVDHQMNIKVSEAFGGYFVRLPLSRSATIRHGNALAIAWGDFVPKEQLSYILGNPPFVGKKRRSAEQQADMGRVFGDRQGSGELDYVAAWYELAARYIQGTTIEVALVSTNSVAQGEQVSLMWRELFDRYRVTINFAHRTFRWKNEARGRAAVHCVIIGFALQGRAVKRLFDYQTPTSAPQEQRVPNINPYLVPGRNILVGSRRTPLSPVPSIVFGNMPNDGGNLLMNDAEKAELLRMEPQAAPFVKPFMSADEFINKENRWCLWLVDAEPRALRALPNILARVNRVREGREKSPRAATQALALTPTQFGEIRQPTAEYILIPRHSSETRRYIPMGYMPPDVIVADSCLAVKSSSLYVFGVLTSAMHMTWVRHVGGRIKSDYRYSNEVVYNNFPWPTDILDRRKAVIERAAQAVLDARNQYPDSSYADLYSPVTMPASLSRAHTALDRAVDLAYRDAPFPNELTRTEYLFGLYEGLILPLIAAANKTATRKARRA